MFYLLRRSILILPFWLILTTILSAQQTRTLTGVILNESQEPMEGVRLEVVGTTDGTVTNDKGQFALAIPAGQAVPLKISFFGYETIYKEITAEQQQLNLQLAPTVSVINDVVISASRVNEKILESPVTIEKLDLKAIQESPTVSVYDAVAQLKGVDITAVSLTFKTLNTRGFNNPANSRFVQRIDGIDMQAPGLSVATGLLNGATDLDVDNVELIPGASSALYGPNAFNGIMNITTKSPFKYPGVSAVVRLGANHLDGKDHSPAPYMEFGARIAKVYKEKWGVKLNVNYLRGTDWYASGNQDVADYTATDNLNRYPRGIGNPGYNGLNVYGDEASNVFDSVTYKDLINFTRGIPAFERVSWIKKPLRISRTGYREQDLTNYNTYSFRSDAGIYYKIKPNLELSWQSRYSRGASVLMADNRFAINNIIYHNHKIELTGKNFFIRSYATFEDAGDSYDTRFAAINLNKAVKSDESWFAQYTAVYMGLFNVLAPAMGVDTLQRGNDAVARQFADGDNTDLIAKLKNTPFAQFADYMGGGARLQPGSKAFNDALEKIKSTPDYNVGARLVDRSSMYHIEGQYHFKSLIPFVELLAGGNYRLYRMNSEGIIFGDSTGPILIHEMGAYLQATSRLMKDRLRISASLRTDYVTAFDPRFTPRIAFVYSADEKKQHNFRLSYQTGFKMPDLRMQHVDFSLGGLVNVIGGFEPAFRYYGLLTPNKDGVLESNAYTIESAQAFWNSGSKDSTLLVKYNNQKIRPEFVQTIEAGYKGLIKNFILLDINGYYSRYQDFLGMVTFIGPKREDVGTPREQLTAKDLQNRDQNRQYMEFRRFTNASQTVTAYGVSAGATFFLSSKFMVNSSINYANLNANQSQGVGSSSLIMSGFNTPRWKSAVSLMGRNIKERFGFAITHRWNDAFLYEFSFASGVVPAYNLIDAQITYKIPSLKTQIALGGNNILNNRHIEVFGGPTIGAMVYVKFTYDDLFN